MSKKKLELIAFVLAFSLLSIQASASSWYNQSWSNRYGWTLTETTGGEDQVNYPVILNLSKSICILDYCKDLLIADNGLKQTFGMDELNSTHITIAMIVNLSASEIKTFYIYTNNSGADFSNISYDDVFLLDGCENNVTASPEGWIYDEYDTTGTVAYFHKSDRKTQGNYSHGMQLGYYTTSDAWANLSKTFDVTSYSEIIVDINADGANDAGDARSQWFVNNSCFYNHLHDDTDVWTYDIVANVTNLTGTHTFKFLLTSLAYHPPISPPTSSRLNFDNIRMVADESKAPSQVLGESEIYSAEIPLPPLLATFPILIITLLAFSLGIMRFVTELEADPKKIIEGVMGVVIMSYLLLLIAQTLVL